MSFSLESKGALAVCLGGVLRGYHVQAALFSATHCRQQARMPDMSCGFQQQNWLHQAGALGS